MNIVLYKNSKILPWKNFKIDDIADYLATLDKYTFDNAQYIKHGLNVVYKLNLSQQYLDMGAYGDLVKYYYMSCNNDPYPVANPFGKLVYYFITDKKWISQNCIELTLKLDVINTFAGSYTLSPKTTIIRQHKNRWRNGTSPELKFPIVDLYTEGITPTLYKKSEDTLYAVYTGGYLDETTWFLIYRSQSQGDDAKVDVLMCADEPLTFTSSTYGYTGWRNIREDFRTIYAGIIYGSDTNSGHNNIGAKVQMTDNHDEEHSITFSSSTCVIYSYDYVAVGYVDGAGFHEENRYHYKQGKKYQKIYLQNVAIVKAMKISQIRYSDLVPTYIENISQRLAVDYSGTTGTYNIGTIAQIDRSDPLLLKIIKLPYCPIQLDLSEESYSILPDNWTIDDQITNYPPLLRYIPNNTTTCFENEIYVNKYGLTLESPLDVFMQRSISAFGKIVAKNKQYETKLLHSDYYRQKFVYDSFSYDFIGEFIVDIDGPFEFQLKMLTSSAMSSRFMFSFQQYIDHINVDMQDYSGLCQIIRNNEVPLYNSAYLNYIRSGYNYDLKTKNRQLTSNIISGVVQSAGAVVSAVAGGPIGVAGAVGLGISAFAKFSSTIFNTIQAEENIAQKLKSAELQGVSVNGADDVDLLTYYTNGTKPKLIRYYVSEKMEKLLFDLFYYCGYIAGFQGVPDTTSRKVFNYVQADILFDTIPNISNELANEIISKYKEGITFIHHYTLYDNNLQQVRGWDLDQQYENWEVNTSN